MVFQTVKGVTPVNALYRFFKSIRLAVVLILLITALSLLSTLVPQGREPGFYQSEYPALYGIIRAIAFDRFFNSLLFLVPIGLFAANLGVCSVDRFVRRTHTKAQKRYGPDLVHIGLLLLMAAGLVTALARQEKDFTMTAGEQMELTASYSIRLVSLEFLKYENGTPKAWISTVDVLHNGNKEMASVPIKVNSPLRLKGVTVFQTSCREGRARGYHTARSLFPGREVDLVFCTSCR
jgi:cytochrome c biogenesis protein